MVFSSLGFLVIFLPVTLLVFFILPIKFRNIWLLICSLSFYYLGAKELIIVLLISILYSYLAALKINHLKEKKRIIFGLILSPIVGLLMFYKYANYVGRYMESDFLISVVMPIGISFFVFQCVSYLIDVYRGEKVIINPLDLALYISFFPQLIAGPIVRYKTIRRQMDVSNRIAKFPAIYEGGYSFVIGLCKKVLFANQLGQLADLILQGEIQNYSVMYAWLGIIAYSLQIYFDFSGYSDMAIGLGKIFGFELPQNFNYPYCATSITDFWRKWHMTLSSWFRDYVYIPLGGNRCSTGRHVSNLFVVWLLTGMWHGPTINFVLWGLVYFVLLIFEKYVIKPQNIQNNCRKIMYRIFSMLAIFLLWTLFYVNTLEQFKVIIKAALGVYGNGFIDTAFLFQFRNFAVLLILGALLAGGFVDKINKRLRKFKIWDGVKVSILCIGMVASIAFIAVDSYNPFLYFAF